MKKKVINILISGVGGQGVLLAGEVVATTFVEAGHDVKMTAAHGMAKRGGSICSHIRIGKKIYSPLISKGDADILVGMELAEACRYVEYLKRDGLIILLDREICPSLATSRPYKYPRDLKSKIRKSTKNVLEISYSGIANGLQEVKTANIFLLGVLSNYFSVKRECWLKAIIKEVPPQMRDLNLTVFELGRRRFLKNTRWKLNL